VIDDDSLYSAGRHLALAGRYDEAIAVLSLAANKNDPRILNCLGYSHRKMGRILVGLGYYREVARPIPHMRWCANISARPSPDGRCWQGQGAACRNRELCGRGCEEYRDLSAQIEAFEAKGG
jgi:tetratricopeptide (TPR) repeat protein